MHKNIFHIIVIWEIYSIFAAIWELIKDNKVYEKKRIILAGLAYSRSYV